MQKGEKLIKLLSFLVVKFILQNCEVGCLNDFKLTFVLLLPFSHYRGEDASCQIGSEDRIDLKDQLCDLLFGHIESKPSLDCLIYDDA